MVLGILGIPFVGLFCVPGILAMIFGSISYRQIQRSAGRLAGRGMAIADLVLGAFSASAYLLLVVLVFARARS